MTGWAHGYVTDVAYTNTAHREATPSWLAASALLLGYRAPDLAAPFRYADLGCGNGLNALTVAAANPHAEIWGFDFNPTHIENARVMAAQSGLTNAHFEEISFEELAASAIAPFDMMAAHGVLSWISASNRRHLTAVIGRILQPGGLAYLSYNATPGWSGIEPLRMLMRQLAETDPRRTEQKSADIFELLDRLRSGGALFFQAHPGLEAKLAEMTAQNARYVAHEFLNKDWHPLMFAEVADAMSETKAHYIGSAALRENIDALSVPPALLPVLQGARTAAIRETIRDLGAARDFRRDLWRRGGETLPVQEQIAGLDALSLVWTGKPIDPENVIRPMFEAICGGPVTAGQLRALPALKGRPHETFVHEVMMLIDGGFAHPAWPHGNRKQTRDAAARLNAAIVRRLRLGEDLPCLAAPVTGSSIEIGVVEGLLIGRLLEDGSRDIEDLVTLVMDDVVQSGRTPGTVADARVLVAGTVREVLSRRMTPLRMMGVLD